MNGYKWYGHFEGDGSTFVITEPETPRHWYNYMYNDEYVTFTSQVGFGEGFAQDDMGRRIPLLSNRNIFICEGGQSWSAFGLPIGYGYTDFSCAHSNGSSVISLLYNDVKSAVRIFVPNEGKYEIWSVTLTNNSDKARVLKVISYAKTELDDPYKPQGYNLAWGGFNKAKNAVFGRYYMPFYSKRNRPVWGYMASSEEATGFDARRNAFIGPYGDEQHPVALRKGSGCTGSDCNSEKLCYVLENTLTLGAGESRTVHYIVGAALSEDEFLRPTDESVASEFAAMEKKYALRLHDVEIETPVEHLN